MILFERILNGWMLKTLVIGVQGYISQGGGSRIRIILGEHTLNIHTPHPCKELESYQIRALGKLFAEQ